MENIHTGRESFAKPILMFADIPPKINVTATLTVEQIMQRVIQSTSPAAVTMTTPSATALYAALGLSDLGSTPGAYYDFSVDNSAGANTVTVALGAGITASSVITGGTTLTVASGAVGHFRLYFTGLTTALISRLS